VGEVLANAFEHAYGNRSGDCEITVDGVLGEQVAIAVRDFAPKGLRPFTVPAMKPSLQDGLGLYLAGRFMDEVTIVEPAEGDGHIVRLIKRLNGHPSQS
jgi:anti-sigma regulatory factor (Ser/Thr protein kinase)